MLALSEEQRKTFAPKDKADNAPIKSTTCLNSSPIILRQTAGALIGDVSLPYFGDMGSNKQIRKQDKAPISLQSACRGMHL